MKSKRIVASLNKVQVPADRKEAMLHSILAQVDAQAASTEKEQKMNSEYRQNGTAKPSGKIGYRIPKKRKALIIAIAAVILLLSACAAYAIYWSSTQRAKEYAGSEQAVDDRRGLAEHQADAIIDGTTYYGAVTGKGEMDGLTIELRGACFWGYGDNELYLRFDAADAKTGDDSRLYDVEYVLTALGKSYPAYAKAEGTDRELPMISDGGPGPGDGGVSAAHQIWFRNLEDEISDGTPLTLACTLYAYHGAEREDSLGSFSIDFTYTVPHAQIEAERERLIADILNGMDADAEAQAETLAGLPDAMTPLGITQDEYTFNDALVTPEGFLLGKTVVTRGADAATVYMDGYIVQGESMSSIFTPDTSRQRLDVEWEVEYFGTSETVARYPWYAPMDELPETVLVAVLRDAGSKQRLKAGVDPFAGTPEPTDYITYSWDAVELLLKVNPRTGEIVLPRNDAERMAWRAETDRQKDIDDRNASFTLKLNGEQTVGGVNVQLYDVIVMSYIRQVSFEWLINGTSYPSEADSCGVSLYIDGVLQSEMVNPNHEPYVFSQEKAEKWVERNGGWQQHNNSFGMFTIDMRANDLPETFTLRIAFDLYDRNENWERVFIGSFDLTTTVNKSDLAPWDDSNFM